MSHHKLVFNELGEEIGHLRITNEGYIISAWIGNQLLKNEKGDEE